MRFVNSKYTSGKCLRLACGMTTLSPVFALQNAKSARKVKKGKAKSQALVALPWLEGCTVQKFAGCDVPSHYRQ